MSSRFPSVPAPAGAASFLSSMATAGCTKPFSLPPYQSRIGAIGSAVAEQVFQALDEHAHLTGWRELPEQLDGLRGSRTPIVARVIAGWSRERDDGLVAVRADEVSHGGAAVGAHAEKDFSFVEHGRQPAGGVAAVASKSKSSDCRRSRCSNRIWRSFRMAGMVLKDLGMQVWESAANKLGRSMRAKRRSRNDPLLDSAPSQISLWQYLALINRGFFLGLLNLGGLLRGPSLGSKQWAWLFATSSRDKAAAGGPRYPRTRCRGLM